MDYYRLKPGDIEVKEIYQRILDVIKGTFEDKEINSYFKPLIHHSRMGGLMEFEEIKEGIGWFNSQLPKESVRSVHFYYDEPHRMNGEKFLTIFKEFLPYYKDWNISSIVMHPSKDMEDVSNNILENVTNPDFIKGLEESGITICMENMSKGTDFYGDIVNLLELRKKICMEYDKIGKSELKKQIKFCFDTGHYMNWLTQTGKDYDSYNENLKEFAKNIKVYHICTNLGELDDHLALRTSHYEIPPDKLKRIEKQGGNEQMLIDNTKFVLKWLKVCNDYRDPSIEQEYMLEINDYFDPERLIDLAKMVLSAIKK